MSGSSSGGWIEGSDVIAGLDPAIQGTSPARKRELDRRVKPGDDKLGALEA